MFSSLLVALCSAKYMSFRVAEMSGKVTCTMPAPDELVILSILTKETHTAASGCVFAISDCQYTISEKMNYVTDI